MTKLDIELFKYVLILHIFCPKGFECNSRTNLCPIVESKGNRITHWEIFADGYLNVRQLKVSLGKRHHDPVTPLSLALDEKIEAWCISRGTVNLICSLPQAQLYL